jgi:hypothetical protein
VGDGMKRAMLLVLMGLAFFTMSACQTNTFKKIYVEDEEFFEYPHIVESDKILIDDDPERFYSFIRNLADYLYENETETQFFVKKDEAIYLLDLFPVIQEETTVYELRIVEQNLAYGVPINPGGWMGLIVEFPFPKYLLGDHSQTTSTEPNQIGVRFDELMRFYQHVEDAHINQSQRTILLDVPNGSVWLSDIDTTTVRIEYFTDDRVEQTAAIFETIDFNEFAFVKAERLADGSVLPPLYDEILGHNSELKALIQPMIESAGVTGMFPSYFTRIEPFKFQFTTESATLMVTFNAWNEGVGTITFYYEEDELPFFVATYSQSQFEVEMTALHAFIEAYFAPTE